MRRALVIAAMVGGGGYIASSANDPTGVAADCDTARLVPGRTELNGAGAVRYTITGSPDETYVVAVDAATVSVDGDRVTATPRPDSIGGNLPRSQPLRLPDCIRTGTIGLDDTAGVRHLTLFRVTGRTSVVEADVTVEVLEVG